jgi:Uma2 family endonuclease
MTEKIKERATYDDLVRAPEDRIAELVDGALYLSPQPAIRHVNATSVLGGELNGSFQRGRGGPGGWWIFDEPELHLGGDVLVPDLAGWRRERMPELPEGVGIATSPDWICEALSPSTESFDRRLKMPRYAAEGVRYLWLLDPSARRLEVFALQDASWLPLESYQGSALVSAPPFEAIAIELDSLWT